MKIIKIVLFLVGLVLIRYVGGVPNDSHNFFITHFIFITPFFLDYCKLWTIENKLFKVLLVFGFLAGIPMLLLNVIGIFQIVEISGATGTYNLTFSPEYYMGFNNLMTMPFFLNISGVIYTYIFVCFILLEDLCNTSPKITEAKGRREAHANTG